MVYRIEGNGSHGGYLPPQDPQKGRTLKYKGYELAINMTGKPYSSGELLGKLKEGGGIKLPDKLDPDKEIKFPTELKLPDKVDPGKEFKFPTELKLPEKINDPKAPTKIPDGGDPVTRPTAPADTPGADSKPYNAENPHPNAGKTTKGQNGYSMTVQDDGSFKYYNSAGKEISAEEFRKTNPNMYSSSLTQNWVTDRNTLRHTRGNVTVSNYNFQLIKSFGDPALYTKNKSGRYVNPSTGEVINEYTYKQLCEAYKDITS